MVLLKEQFEAAKKNQGFKRGPKKFKEIDTGFLRTRKVRCQACNQGYMYRYRYFDEEQDKHRVLSSVDFLQLKKKVKDKNLKWSLEDYQKARKTAKEVGLPLKDLK